MTKDYGLTSFEDPMTVILEQRSQNNMQNIFFQKILKTKKFKMAKLFALWKSKCLSMAWALIWSHKPDLVFLSSACCFPSKMCGVWKQS